MASRNYLVFRLFFLTFDGPLVTVVITIIVGSVILLPSIVLVTQSEQKRRRAQRFARKLTHPWSGSRGPPIGEISIGDSVIHR